MKYILFGWLLKPHMEVTALDGLIGSVEIIVFSIIIGSAIYAYGVYLEKGHKK